MFDNKKIFILGMARSGYEAAKVLAKRNNVIVLNDISDEQNKSHIQELKDLGVQLVLGSHPDGIITDDFDYLIKNPGIRNDHKYVVYCNEHNIPVINEFEMAFHLLPKDVKIIGITGSNGKTTTTTLIYELLKHGDRPVHLTGNIGFPLSGFIGKIKEGDTIVMEIAGHHLVNFIDFKTTSSVLTNLFPIHLDFHGTYDNYKSIKKRIFNHQNKDNIAVINFDNEDVMNTTKDIKSTKIYFSSSQKCNGAYLENGSIYYNGEEIIRTSEMKIKGVHNYENIMCAIIIAISEGISIEKIKLVLKEFGGVEHRIEFVRTLNKVSYYNDSKSTNNKATQIALSAFNAPINLILGGFDRGQEFDELEGSLENVKFIACYGETKYKIEKLANKCDIHVEVVNTLREAINLCYKNAHEGDIVLLSPACASWDQYKCFEDRGNEFKDIVNNF